MHRVAAYFDGKTAGILERYGPGPRVHYHTGLVDDPPARGATVAELRQELVRGQELMLQEAAAAWDASQSLSGEILDIGCGLGGGSIFWAQEFGAQVTALTCVPSHAEHVARFATQAGVDRQVEALVCDASAVPGKDRFDGAVAVDASGYLPRRDWLDRMASLLRPGGSVFIIDCFLEDRKYADLFNSHWHTRIGTLDEYFTAARDSGLKAGSVVDVTDRTVHFWTTTLALIDVESAAGRGYLSQPLCGVLQGPSSRAGWSLQGRPSLRNAEFLQECRRKGARGAGAFRNRSFIVRTRAFPTA